MFRLKPTAPTTDKCFVLKKHLKPITTAMILSLLLHLCLWNGLSLTRKPHKPPVEKIEIVVLDSPAPVKKAQVVEQPPSIHKEKPKSAKYLSAENQRVEKETRATKTGDFNNEAGGSITPSGRTVPRDQTHRNNRSTPQKTFFKKQALKKVNPDTLSILKDLTPKVSLTPRENLTPNAKKPLPQSSRKAGRESATRDYLKDKEKGIQTLLNTREFAYYSYYQRIRKKIQLFWEPAIKQKVHHIFATGRKIASTQDRITKVIIVLNDRGELVNVQVLGQSGIRDLDEAAVEAFRAAEPFPNPPKGMTEKDGKIRIRWDFVLEV